MALNERRYVYIVDIIVVVILAQEVCNFLGLTIDKWLVIPIFVLH